MTDIIEIPAVPMPALGLHADHPKILAGRHADIADEVNKLIGHMSALAPHGRNYATLEDFTAARDVWEMHVKILRALAGKYDGIAYEIYEAMR